MSSSATWTQIDPDDPDLPESWTWTVLALGGALRIGQLPDAPPPALYDGGDRVLWAVSDELFILAKTNGERQVFEKEPGGWQGRLYQGGRLVVKGVVGNLDLELEEMVQAYHQGDTDPPLA